ncbi:MAG: adenylate/guanylate cyclase domain-containing protein, partial [Alphaproteobacteria bacterium]
MERRLAAILAADVVGYSRLIGADETGTLAALRAHLGEVVEPALERHRGRIVKLMGDGLLAEFASVVDAVAAAVEIQEITLARPADPSGGPRMALRIGVNMGDIAVEDGDLFGDGVNIAARLQEIADPGGVVVSDDAYRQLSGRLDVPFEDGGEKALKNIAQPVRIWQWPPSKFSIDPPPVNPAAGLTDKPSIAVLPFDNLSGDREQEFFADGIAEDVITALSRIRQFHVVARNTTFTFKGKSVDIQAVAKDLGVRYVLEGSVRKAGKRVRITAQLIDGGTGNHLWAERYDRELEDVFEVQDDIVRTVIGAMGPELDRAEQERAIFRPPGNLDAWELHYRGMAQLYKRTVEGNVEARRMFAEAVDRDPNFAAPHAGMSRTYATDHIFGISDSDQSLAVHHGKRAVELDDRDAFTHLALGLAYWLVAKEFDAAIIELEEARRINPSDAQVQHAIGRTMIASGRAGEALPYLQEAVRLSPADMMFGIFCAG